jgi:hypothetical protein
VAIYRLTINSNSIAYQWSLYNNTAEGYFLAKYDLYTNHPKLYVYGYVDSTRMKEDFKHVDIKLVFRGCLIGDERYQLEKSYNQTIVSEMKLPQVCC